MRAKYERRGCADKQAARQVLTREGQYLLPLIDVFVQAGHALDTIIDVIGRAAIEAVLELSAADVAGPRQPGRRRGEGSVAYHGRQTGRVYLSDRAVRVEKPRLRRSGEGEVAILAYEVLRRSDGLRDRMLELLLRGVSTRAYGEAIGKMAETVGVSTSSVSRRATEAAGERLKELAERRLDDRDYLVVYLDGIQFAGHHVLVALGVDTEGNFSSASEKARARMRPWRWPCSKSLSSGALTHGCSSSTARRRCARRSARSSGRHAVCSAVATTRCATFLAICRRRCTTRPGRFCGQPGS